MFRSMWCRVGANLKRTITAINGEPSPSSSTRYILFKFQNPNVIIESRVSSISCSFSTSNNHLSSSSSYSDSSLVGYLINSCGLSEIEAISVSKKIKLKPTSKPDSIVNLFENHGFTKPHISKIITKQPSLLLSDPLKTLKPKLDFFNSKGLHGIELAGFISKNPTVLTVSLKSQLIPSFDILKSILHTDTDVITALKSSYRILNVNVLENMMVNLEVLRYEGVPESTISKFLINEPRAFMGDAGKFRKSVEKVKGMDFDPLSSIFLVAIRGLTWMSNATWKTKVEVFKGWGWSEDHIKKAFRKNPYYMMHSEKKITAVMDFLVNEMGYDSLTIAENPVIFHYSLKNRIIPRCSIIRILLSKGLIKKKIPLTVLSVMTDESFSERFVKLYEKEAPEVMKVFQGELNYEELFLK